MDLHVNVRVNVPELSEIRSRFSGHDWVRLLAQIAADLGAQIRKNISIHGRASGDWPALHGFNKNRVDTGKRTKAGSKITKPRSKRTVSRHSGYARRKERGGTPGRGKFGPGYRLRDTNAMAASVIGVVDGNTVYVDAPGQIGNRPDNNTLLYFHATGAGRNPVRDPTDPAEMVQFEARVKKRLEEILDRPPPSGPPAVV